MLGPLVTVGAEAEVAVQAVYSARNRLIVLEGHILPFDRAPRPLGEVVAQRTSVLRAQVLQRRVNRLQRKPFCYLGSLLLAVLRLSCAACGTCLCKYRTPLTRSILAYHAARGTFSYEPAHAHVNDNVNVDDHGYSP